MRINTLLSIFLATLSTGIGVTSNPIPNASPEDPTHGSIQALSGRAVHNVDPLRPELITRSLDEDTLFSLLHARNPDPIDSEEEDHDLTITLGTRAGSTSSQTVEETSTYKLFSAAHSGMTKDGYYAFTAKYTTGTAPGDDSTEAVMAEVQKDYGFDHIVLVVGKVTETSTKKKLKRDFVAVMHHLIITTYPNTIYQKKNWSLGKTTPKIEFVKTTTAKKDSALAAKGKAYEKEHTTWEAKVNDCQTFVTYMEGYI
ncbi:uncharacterized protein BP01DRAFT_100131 [Aspergillus saccharolyticus JOP 1030-1]|uniref:Uncharacterized protein n=1 Tax=Aspergillus saccharolyticus JOP 1030-1 TaxID=1450539 RepID=A0A318Z8M7_9EURO|nr:hypothetical protein BP01DRAFT_100131 [Aspergillus saccharolyticus JOP 1030-1]PYH43529.1 hypothetical protein BP01DRAFT_100131 [Aspergillus saccharolyticus JOP 1030-1]